MAVGCSFRRSSSHAQRRTSVAPRRACRPSARRRAGESVARSAAVGGAWRQPVRSSVAARMIRRSIARASLARISWPQSARSSAWATVAERGSAAVRAAAGSRGRGTGRAEAENERRVVVVEREAAPELLERLLARRAQVHRPVGSLPRDPAPGRQLGVEYRVSKGAGRIACEPRRERERVRARAGGRRRRPWADE